jgi:hypothetical protein
MNITQVPSFARRFLRAHLQQHVGKVAVRELEVPLVVELEQGRAVRVLVLEVEIVHFRLLRRVAALLANVDLRQIGATLLLYVSLFLARAYDQSNPR